MTPEQSHLDLVLLDLRGEPHLVLGPPVAEPPADGGSAGRHQSGAGAAPTVRIGRSGGPPAGPEAGPR